MRFHRILWWCGFPRTPPTPEQLVQSAEYRAMWLKETLAKFDDAGTAIERLKQLVSNIKREGNTELIVSLSQAQFAIQDVAQKQKYVIAQFDMVWKAHDQLSKETCDLRQKRKNSRKTGRPPVS